MDRILFVIFTGICCLGFFPENRCFGDLIGLAVQSGDSGTLDNPIAQEIATFNLTGAPLQTITGFDITFTVDDGDSAVGDADYNNLVLYLNGVNTGLLVNGFGDGSSVEVSFNSIGLPSLVAAQLNATLGTNTLVATIVDLTPNSLVDSFTPNGTNYISYPFNHSGNVTSASVVIHGITAVPEPSAILLSLIALSSFGGVRMLNRDRKEVR
jgi:hypothetical protein